MKLGLIGAIGGLGKAVETFGSDIVRRREQALENARKEAEYQRNRADKEEDAATAREHQSTLQAERERAADERTEAQIRARREELKARLDDNAATRESRFKLEDKKLAGAKELARLRSSLDAENTAAAIRLRDKLAADDIERIEYGKPDADGYAEVIKITKDGKQINTGERVYKPKLDFKEDEEEEEDDPFS